MGKAIDALKNAAGGAAGGALGGPVGMAVGAGMGLLKSGIQGYMQNKINKSMADYQHQLNEESAENAFNRSRKMRDELWAMNSPEMQRLRLEQAGLNVGLMYGGGGGGGGSASAATAAAGAQANTGMPEAVNLSEIKQARIADEMAQANMELIKANAEKAKAEADKIAGVDTSKVESDIKLNEQLTNHESIKAGLTTLQSAFQESTNRIQSATEGTLIQNVYQSNRQIKASAEKLIAETKGIAVDNFIKEESADSVIEQVNAKLRLTNAEAMLKDSQNKLTLEQCEEITASIYETYENMRLKGRSLDLTDKQIEEIIRHNLIQEGFSRHQVWQGYSEIGVDLFKSFIPFAGGKEAVKPVKGFGK